MSYENICECGAKITVSAVHLDKSVTNQSYNIHADGFIDHSDGFVDRSYVEEKDSINEGCVDGPVDRSYVKDPIYVGCVDVPYVDEPIRARAMSRVPEEILVHCPLCWALNIIKSAHAELANET